jgi:hypothetical protein
MTWPSDVTKVTIFPNYLTCIGTKFQYSKDGLTCVKQSLRHKIYKVILFMYVCVWPIPVAARFKAWVYGRTLAGIVGFNSRRGHGCLSLVSVVYCQIEVFATGWSLVQRSPIECGVSECNREASIMRRPWFTRGCHATGKKCGVWVNMFIYVIRRADCLCFRYWLLLLTSYIICCSTERRR